MFGSGQGYWKMLLPSAVVTVILLIIVGIAKLCGWEP